MSYKYAVGAAALLSVVLDDVLLPLALTVLLLAALPTILRLPPTWMLSSYWASLPTSLGQTLPMRQLLVSLAAMAIPLLLALHLFSFAAGSTEWSFLS